MSDSSAPSSKPKSRLGRGLSSLISVSELPVEASAPAPQTAPTMAASQETSASPAIQTDGQIPVDQVVPNPHQPRREMNDASLAELAASLKSTGLIQPIIVRKIETGYQLIAGERRLRAAKIAGLKTIPAIVRQVDAFTQAQMALVENIQREDLNPIDRAQAYRALMSQLGLTHQELAIRLGEDRSSISNFIRLLDLADPVRELIRSGKLSLGHSKILAAIQDSIEQKRLADLCIAQDLSVRNLERLLTSNETPPLKSEAKPASAHVADLEKSIARQLGMRVNLRSGNKGKGKLVIHYASLDQFDELLQKMGVKVD